MKKFWIVSLLLPALAFCSSENGDLFYFSTQDESSDYLIGLEDSEEFDGEALSLFEKSLDDGDSSLLPWAIDESFLSEVDTFVEKRANQLTQEIEDLYTYEVSVIGKGNHYIPSIETIPSEKRAIFARPKVVEAKPTQVAEPTLQAQKEGEPSPEIALRPSRFRKGQPKTVASKKKIASKLQESKEKTSIRNGLKEDL